MADSDYSVSSSRTLKSPCQDPSTPYYLHPGGKPRYRARFTATHRFCELQHLKQSDETCFAIEEQIEVH